MGKRTRLRFAVLLLGMMMILPGWSAAASYEFSAASKAAFTKMTASADQTLAAKLQTQYEAFSSLQKQGTQLDTQTEALHTRNEEGMKAVRQRIKEIDADKLAKLDTQVKQAQAKYKPLFASYTALNDRIEAARVLKNKELNAVLKLQASVMKVSVQLARDDIRNKQAALKTAKTNAAASAKKVRGVLEETDPLKVKIQAEKRVASSARQTLGTEWTALNQAVKKADAKSASSTLATLLTLAKQINDAKQKQYGFEQKIADTIARAKALIPG